MILKGCIGSTIEITENENKFISKWASSSYKINLVYNPSISRRKDSENHHAVGLRGQYAFCKLFNLPFVRQLNIGEDKGDITLKDGTTIDVKTTIWQGGKLLLNEKSTVKADYYALMVDNQNGTYTFRGFMRGPDLRQPCRLKYISRDVCYIAYQNELTDKTGV